MKFEIGGKYDFAIREEGVIFDIDDSGANLMVFMRNPTKEEIDQFKSKKPLEIRCAFFKHTIFFLLMIGNLRWMDAPYHTDLSMSLTELKEPEEGEGLAVQIMLFDSSDGELKSIRLVGANTDFTKRLYGEIKSLSADSITYDEYMFYIDKMYKKYTTKDLVRMSTIGFRIKGSV